MTTMLHHRPERIAVGVDGSVASHAAARHHGSATPTARIAMRSIRHGAIAAGAMALIYLVVVRAASGSWSHLVDQARRDWYYLVAILVGFGTQVTLVSELRHRRRFGRGATVTAGAGAGASTAGMVACCAHHLADLLPIVGAASAAGFVTDYRVPFMLAGITINGVAVTLAARRLRHTTLEHNGEPT